MRRAIVGIRREFFGFFNASRIYPLNHQDFRAITEFPMFSFLLGDLHPHVMALPFVLLAVGAALSLYRSQEPLDITFWLQRPLALVAGAILHRRARVRQHVGHRDDVVRRRRRGLRQQLHARARDHASTSSCRSRRSPLPLLLLAVLVYLPFLVSIWGNSQADGIGAVVSNKDITVPGTRPFHALLFWGPLFVVVIPFVGARLLAARERITGRIAAIAAAPGAFIVLGWVLLFAFEKATGNKHLGNNAGGFAAQIADRGSALVHGGIPHRRAGRGIARALARTDG